MEDRMRKYIDGLFADATPTRKLVELKEEMIQNLHDKYNDLVAEGKTDEAAYNIAIASIGDISGLLAELEDDAERLAYAPDTRDAEKAQCKSAMLMAIAIMMYILSFLPLIMLSMANARYTGIIGLPIMFLMVAAATGLLIYNSMTSPKRSRRDDTIVEEFREWQSDEKDRKALKNAISSALWSVIVALYFIISFTTYAWHITWVMFLGGAALQSFLNVFFALKKR